MTLMSVNFKIKQPKKLLKITESWKIQNEGTGHQLFALQSVTDTVTKNIQEVVGVAEKFCTDLHSHQYG